MDRRRRAGTRVHGLEAARQYVADLLISCRAEKMVLEASVAGTAGTGPLPGRPAGRRSRLGRTRIAIARGAWPIAFAADLGITSVDWAVAETGTLALCSHPGQGRVVSLLPPNYLAIIEPSQIVPDLFDLFTQLEPHGDLPSNLALVTGPSKTGDIELKLPPASTAPVTCMFWSLKNENFFPRNVSRSK